MLEECMQRLADMARQVENIALYDPNSGRSRPTAFVLSLVSNPSCLIPSLSISTPMQRKSQLLLSHSSVHANFAHLLVSLSAQLRLPLQRKHQSERRATIGLDRFENLFHPSLEFHKYTFF